jgi:hypothetical protein
MGCAGPSGAETMGLWERAAEWIVPGMTQQRTNNV